MSIITTTDNNCGKEVKDLIIKCDDNIEKAHAFGSITKDINRVANETIKNLCEKENVILFPQNTADKIEDKNIFTLSSDNKLTTNNIMGFIGVNDTSINIKSRFANYSDEDYFLHYMLCKVFSINVVNLETHSSKDKVLDFLIYLFPYFFNRALRQGVFKKYQKYKYNDSNIKGAIDIKRHIRKNIPFMCKIAYNARDHSYDNHITQLIRHTIEYIKTKHHGNTVLSSLETKDNVSKIFSSTALYNKNERDKIINKNIKSSSHPYFYEYLPLQKICMQILRHDKNKIGSDKDKIYGILFDGSWLWEEYLNKVLEGKFIHTENKQSKGKIPLFENNNKYRCYPDFYCKDKKIVMDAKYKRINKSEETDKGDLYQLITYMHILKSDNGVLIYPDSGSKICLGALAGSGGYVYKYGFDVSDNNIINDKYKQPFKRYSDKMIKLESDLTTFLASIINKNNHLASDF